MWDDWFLFFLGVFFLLFASFLNFVSSLYSDVDISKIDLSLINRKKKRVKQILYVIKNSYFLFVGVCVFLVFFHILISRLIVDNFFWSFLFDKLSFSSQKFWSKFWLLPEMIVALFLAFFTEIIVRYFADKDFFKRKVFNPFLLNFAYFIAAATSLPLKWVIKEKKVSNYKEKDLIRLMNNLEAENILEPHESRLIKAAFRFDDETVKNFFCHRQRVIFLVSDMSFKEIQDIYRKYHFTRYPVLTKKNEIFGVLNFKTLNLNMNEKETDWKKFVNKKFVHITTDYKLNTVLEKFQKNHEHLAIVIEKEKFLGIITLEDILENLVGEIHDENENKLLTKKKS